MRDRPTGRVPGGAAAGGGAGGGPGPSPVEVGRDASPGVRCVVAAAVGLAVEGVPVMGLLAGERPADDVSGLAVALCGVEAALGMRMAAATRAGVLPLPAPGGLLTARYWSPAAAARLARAGGLALDQPRLAQLWAAGVITCEHVDAVARNIRDLTGEQVAAVLAALDELWGQVSPQDVASFVGRARRIIHPPPEDPSERERGDYEARFVSLSFLDGLVHLTGALPRVEGDLLAKVLTGMVERLRVEGDGLSQGQRQADALIELVHMANRNTPTDPNSSPSPGSAAQSSLDVGWDGASEGSVDSPAAGSLSGEAGGSGGSGGVGRGSGLPVRGGLPTGLTVLLDPGWGLAWTSTGHLLTGSELRFVTCDALVTPITIRGCAIPDSVGTADPPAWAVRLAGLAARAQGTAQPLEVGRTQRTATPAQRRALAVRDGGCVMPGCGSPAENCQPHHIIPWSAGGCTDLQNLVSLCWAHHRQTELGYWTIEHGRPKGGCQMLCVRRLR